MKKLEVEKLLNDLLVRIEMIIDLAQNHEDALGRIQNEVAKAKDALK